MSDIRPLTLLHSNDMHGDFLAEEIDDKLVGGVSLLSGYIRDVRSKEPNTLYCIAGDMFRGSIIDSEFKGVSTVDIINMLGPDVVSLGNHELDYGIAHLLFLEKCVKFPIVNSNLYIRTTGTRLFSSHVILEVGGMKIFFMGIITEDIMASAKSDMLLGTFVNINAAAEEVGRVIDSYKGTDIDLTVLLTHIGFEEDKKLAAALDPEWGVDIIVGGHSHTWLKEPEKVNDILIVQAGIGTDYIGRFDLNIDCDTNSIDSYTWQLVPIDKQHCPEDTAISDIIYTYKSRTDEKYGRILTHLDRALTHPRREEETEVGNLFTDIFAENFNVDLAIVGSGSIRQPLFGPIVTLQNLIEMYPYVGKMYKLELNGEQIKRFFTYICRDEMYAGHTEFYQISKGWHFVYDYNSKKLLEATFNGQDVRDEQVYTISLPEYHYNNLEDFLGISTDEVANYGHNRVLCTDDQGVLIEALTNSLNLNAKLEDRIVILNRPE